LINSDAVQDEAEDSRHQGLYFGAAREIGNKAQAQHNNRKKLRGPEFQSKFRQRLREDHENARVLAEGLAEFPGVKIDLRAVQTNIIIFDMERQDIDAAGLVLKLAGQGVKCFTVGPNRIRMVTHKDVDRAGILYALEALRTILA